MKRLNSTFTDNMDKCCICDLYDEKHLNKDRIRVCHGECYNIERHHVFEGRQGFKKVSEEYGYIIPMNCRLHPNGVFADGVESKKLDLELKQLCQKDFERSHTREEFIQTFGKSYL